MLWSMCKSKIHRARVTECNLSYIGSITIDENLMRAANLREFEQVHVVNNNNGARFVTYVITGEPGSHIICLNGAASRLVQIGDVLIIIAYAQLTDSELDNFHPKIVHVDASNKIIHDPDAVATQLKLQKSVSGNYLASMEE